MIAAPTMNAFFEPSPGKAAAFGSMPVPRLGSMHLQYTDLPANATCEVLIKVYASSVNPSDLHPRVSRDSYPKALGSDVAGVVLNTTRGCTRIKSGDRVWGDIGANSHTKGGATKELGGYAQYAVALEAQLATMPDSLSFEEAGSLPKVALTTIKAYEWYGGLSGWRPNATVLVLGGSGGCGTVGIQLAKALAPNGAFVITTTSKANFGYVQSLGADRPIDYHSQNWWDVVADDSVDAIYDTVGQFGTGSRAMKKLREGGHYVTITGQLSPVTRKGRFQAMFINSDTNLGSANLMEALSEVAAKGKLRMTKRVVFTLDNVAMGFALSSGGHVVGKVVISVRNESEW